MSKIFTITEGLQNLGALKTGGQGSVYKGMRMGPVYSAIKLIPTPIYLEDESDKNYKNFRNEVNKLHQVNIHPSPNVVKMLSSGITDSGSFPYIEMEYIEGPELGELLLPPHQKVFTVKELLKVAEQLAAALAHCHRVEVKHGDIKSNNVKYNEQTGNYVLLDFGLAIMSEEQRRTSIRHAGAIEFMAPEQHEGKMLLQTDIYSYGIILYELLAGQVPFPLDGGGDTARNIVMAAHLEQDIPDAMILRKSNLVNAVQNDVLEKEMNVPGWLLDLIGRCLKKKPADRFASGMELYNSVTAGLVSNPPQDLRNVENNLPNETLHHAALYKETKEENQRLEKELASLKPLALKAGIKYNTATRRYYQENYLHVSKKVISGLAAACILLFAILAYTLATTGGNVTAIPSPAYKSPFEIANAQYRQGLQAAREDSVRTAKTKSAQQAKAAEKANKRSGKKKKRFLGIF